MAADFESPSRRLPPGFTIRHFANIGGGEDFVVYASLEMLELVDASMIDGTHRQQVKDAIVAISTEGLMPAFEHLKKIRAEDTPRLPELNRRQLYEDFTIAIWRSYKVKFQEAAQLIDPEFTFLFQREVNFEAGIARWAKKRPKIVENAAQYFRRQRSEWQNELADFRNDLEHGNGRTDYARRYNAKHAEMVFDSVWHAVADILAMLITLHLHHSVSLVEIPVAERDPERPRRFRYRIHDGTQHSV